MALKPLTPPDKTFYCHASNSVADYERCTEENAEIIVYTYPRPDLGYNRFRSAFHVITQAKIPSIGCLPDFIVKDCNLSKEKQDIEDAKDEEERADFERRWKAAKQSK